MVSCIETIEREIEHDKMWLLFKDNIEDASTYMVWWMSLSLLSHQDIYNIQQNDSVLNNVCCEFCEYSSCYKQLLSYTPLYTEKLPLCQPWTVVEENHALISLLYFNV